MPTIAFFPWAYSDANIGVGEFEIIPYGVAVSEKMISPEHVDPVATILEAHGLVRPVDRAKVALLRRAGLDFTADLSDADIADYFDFRIKLTTAILSARRFFHVRYANSDHVQLTIQQFTPERAGAATITSRRRDGSTTTLIPKGHFKIERPRHVHERCNISEALDIDLLRSLNEAQEDAGKFQEGISDALRLFVGANTDSPNVGPHSELVDTISAFSRLSGSWNESGTVEGFLNALPAHDADMTHSGAKLSLERVQEKLASGQAMREVWLRDAYVLRSQLGHGHVVKSPYDSIWTDREHLLLAATAFPLYLKAELFQKSLYTLTGTDRALNFAFDTLTTLEPFSDVTGEGAGWTTVIGEAALELHLREDLDLEN